MTSRRSSVGDSGAPKAQRALSIVAVAVALALAPGVWRWVTQDARDWTPNERLPGAEGPSISARGVQKFEARDAQGRLAWEFAAKSIDLSSDKRWATLESVERAILFRDGKPYLEMSASQVRFDQQTRDWQAHDSLRVSGPDGLLIQSSTASWNEKEQRLDCPDKVAARFKGANIQTTGIAYNARNGELQSFDAVSLQAPNLSAKGSRMVADTKKRIIRFPQGMDDLTIRKPLLKQYGYTR